MHALCIDTYSCCYRMVLALQPTPTSDSELKDELPLRTLAVPACRAGGVSAIVAESAAGARHGGGVYLG